MERRIYDDGFRRQNELCHEEYARIVLIDYIEQMNYVASDVHLSKTSFSKPNEETKVAEQSREWIQM